MKFLALASAFFAVARAATAKPGPSKVREYTLDIVNAQAAPDGHVRSIVSANGTFPGPLIKANKGDTLRIHMNNKLTDPTMRRSTTLDFDGLFFDEKNVFSEGTPWVTTCPIGPGASYTYEIPLGDQTGTYWYHSQLSLQYTDGLRGPLIIYDPDDPHKDLYDFDDENTIWFLSDWWHNSTIPMLELYRATQVIPVADGGLLNGAGRFNTGPLVPYDVTNVKSGKRYRMRIICANTRNDMILSIDNHDMTIIAADGVPTVPHTVHQMDILAGQRYDVIVTANQPVANYWINAILGGGNRARNPNLNVTLSRGVLHYEGAPNAEPTTPMTNGTGLNVLDEGDLRPLVPEVPPPFDIELTFLTSMTVNKTEWNINNVSYISPDSPTLVRMIDGTGNDQSDYAVSENTFVLPRNKVVQINFPPSTEDELHPFHLHGSNFWAIKANASAANEVNPIRRDVLGAGAGGTTVRFRTDKVGPWFFHCHIFWHLSAGLASVMAVDPADASKTIQPTAEWDSLCDAYAALPEDEK